MSTAIEERQLVSGIHRLRAENAELRDEIERLEAIVQNLTADRAARPTSAQALSVMEENRHLEAVNDALVKRNTILVAKLKASGIHC